MRTIQGYIEDAKKEIYSESKESKIIDKQIQKMLFDMAKLIRDNPDMKDAELKKLANGIQKMLLDREIKK